MAGEAINEKALNALVDIILAAVEKRLEEYDLTLEKKLTKIRVGSENIIPASITNLQVKDQGIDTRKIAGLRDAIVEVLAEHSLV